MAFNAVAANIHESAFDMPIIRAAAAPDLAQARYP
jgi:hypothetical protein